MISRLETMDGLPIPQDPFALRIVSAGQSYGLNTPFLDIWQGNGLLISRMDGAVTLAGIPEEKSICFCGSAGCRRAPRCTQGLPEMPV